MAIIRDRDVLELVEAVQKMIRIENENKLDIFKESVSLPGLTQRLLFKDLDSNDYFAGFSREHKIRRENIVGDPSIIFHRYQERGVTKTKDKHLRFHEIMDLFDLKQHISEPTHIMGDTTDVVFTRNNDANIEDIWIRRYNLSRHFLIDFVFNTKAKEVFMKTITHR